MATKTERVGASAAVDLNPPQPNRIWQAVKTVVKNIRRDFLVFLVVLEFLSFLGAVVFVVAAIYLWLRNTSISLTGFVLIGMLLYHIGIILSYLQGYWEHLIKPVDEYER